MPSFAVRMPNGSRSAVDHVADDYWYWTGADQNADSFETLCALLDALADGATVEKAEGCRVGT